jgi:hypothetical protein
MTPTKQKADLDGAIVDDGAFLAIHLLSGHRVIAHLCSRRPLDRHDIALCSLGPGLVTASGGTFNCTKDGRVECIAYVINGRMVVSFPEKFDLYAQGGMKAVIGPITSGK